MSQLTGGIVADLRGQFPEYDAHVIASGLAILAGSIVLFIGLIRCGWIVDLISLTALSAFMTGSAINIVVGQVPAMMGIQGFSTRDAPYLVFIHTLQGLRRTSLDAAMGLTALVMLYAIRSICNLAARRWRQHQRLIFFLATLRTVFVILLYTLVSWLVNRGLSKKNVRFAILLDVPRGFQNSAIPMLNHRLASSLIGYLPATVIVLLIEHIAISKSFGRMNNYSIDPSQEMVAIGVTNLLGPFLGGYAATGSFSRTAIKAKAGVRTPFAGVITAMVVLLAIYALPALFYYIPKATLSAVIIHAVGDLITPPNTIYQFWLVSPLEVFIFFAGVVVTVFSSIENGIYCTVCISAGMLLIRILKGKGRFLGRVTVRSVLGERVMGGEDGGGGRVTGEYGTFLGADEARTRDIFLPIGHADGSNPEVEVGSPYPGIFIYRFSEGFNYPNASHSLEYMTAYILRHTRRTNTCEYARAGDRPWSDPGPSRRQLKEADRQGVDIGTYLGEDSSLPTLRAVILDFSSVNHVDMTSVQQLIDVRNQLDRHAAPAVVDWHMACIANRWTKRALVSAGFGYQTDVRQRAHWRPIFSVADIGGDQSAACAAEKKLELSLERSDVEAVVSHSAASSSTDRHGAEGDEGKNGSGSERRRTVAVHGLNRPLFHVDLTSALQSAIANVEATTERRGGEC